MVPSMLLMFFFVLFATLLVAAGTVSWPVGIIIGVGMLLLERKLFAASHATDGDDASDEPHHHHPAVATASKRH